MVRDPECIRLLALGVRGLHNSLEGGVCLAGRGGPAIIIQDNQRYQA